MPGTAKGVAATCAETYNSKYSSFGVGDLGLGYRVDTARPKETSVSCEAYLRCSIPIL